MAAGVGEQLFGLQRKGMESAVGITERPQFQPARGVFEKVEAVVDLVLLLLVGEPA